MLNWKRDGENYFSDRLHLGKYEIKARIILSRYINGKQFLEVTILQNAVELEYSFCETPAETYGKRFEVAEIELAKEWCEEKVKQILNETLIDIIKLLKSN